MSSAEQFNKAFIIFINKIVTDAYYKENAFKAIRLEPTIFIRKFTSMHEYIATLSPPVTINQFSLSIITQIYGRLFSAIKKSETKEAADFMIDPMTLNKQQQNNIILNILNLDQLYINHI